MAITTGSAICWVFIYFAIWFFFIKKDEYGECRDGLGAFLILLNCFAAWLVAEETIAFLATIIGTIYFFIVFQEKVDEDE